MRIRKEPNSECLQLPGKLGCRFPKVKLRAKNRISDSRDRTVHLELKSLKSCGLPAATTEFCPPRRSLSIKASCEKHKKRSRTQALAPRMSTCIFPILGVRNKINNS